MLRLHSRPMATKAAAGRAKRAAASIPQTPQLRRNTKRIQEAVAQTAIASVAQSLATASPLRVLGLDINTNSTGYAVLNAGGRVENWGHITTTQFGSSDILATAHAISDALADVRATAQDAQWRVGIEDFMRMYRFGKFHNKGIFQLAQLNGIVSYSCWQRFGCRPVHTHPTAARGLFGIIASKKSDASVKEKVMAFVLAREVDSHARAELPVNRFGQWTDEAYDMADAYVVASYTRWMALQEQLQLHLELQRQFSEAYVSLAVSTEPTATKKKPASAEATALMTMDASAKRTFLQELFAVGVSDWVKQQTFT